MKSFPEMGRSCVNGLYPGSAEIKMYFPRYFDNKIPFIYVNA
jgi:hypothetical protein